MEVWMTAMSRRIRTVTLAALLAPLTAAGWYAAPGFAARRPGGSADRPPPATASASSTPWNILEPGLELGSFEAPLPAAAGDSRIRVLRIDPRRFRLELLMASAADPPRRLSARDWCLRNDLVAAINASMYQEDLLSSVALMRAPGHVNNPRLSRDRAILAFDPLRPGLPEVQILDSECGTVEELRDLYGTLVQSIRMISCTGRNVWAAQPRRFSAAATGLDGAGRVLFLHARSAYSMHDLIEMLRQLPLDLRGALYGDGGSEAQLYVRAGGREYEFTGSHDPDHAAEGGGPPVPNVIGVARRGEPPSAATPRADQ
jgi:Phosphodiester glycosidase